MIGSVEIEIFSSKLGLASDPQNYIAGVKVRGLPEKWIYESEEQTFQHYLSVSFREVLPEQLSGKIYTMLDNIAGSLFYPLTLKAQGDMLTFTLATTIAISTLILA